MVCVILFIGAESQCGGYNLSRIISVISLVLLTYIRGSRGQDTLYYVIKVSIFKWTPDQAGSQ